MRDSPKAFRRIDTLVALQSPVAQLVEQAAVNRLVVGSSPTGGACLRTGCVASPSTTAGRILRVFRAQFVRRDFCVALAIAVNAFSPEAQRQDQSILFPLERSKGVPTGARFFPRVDLDVTFRAGLFP